MSAVTIIRKKLAHAKITAWWKAAGLRAARTTLVTIAPFLAGGITDVHWAVAASTAGLAGILSLLTSLAGLPELASGAPRWLAWLSRAGKTFAQSLVASIGTTAVLLSQVDWTHGLSIAAVATLGSLILAAVGVLPETSTAADTALAGLLPSAPGATSTATNEEATPATDTVDSQA